MPLLLPVFVLLFGAQPVESTVRLLSASGKAVAVQTIRSPLGQNVAVVFDRIPVPNSSRSFQVSVSVQPGFARRGGIPVFVTVGTKIFDGNTMTTLRSGSSGYDTVWQESRPYTLPIPMASYAGGPLTVEISARQLR